MKGFAVFHILWHLVRQCGRFLHIIGSMRFDRIVQLKELLAELVALFFVLRVHFIRIHLFLLGLPRFMAPSDLFVVELGDGFPQHLCELWPALIGAIAKYCFHIP